MKKCLGCGSILQDSDKDARGYTPKISNDLCQRCFKLKHYGTLTSFGKKQDNGELLKKINATKGFVLFVTDFLNLYSEVIDTYKRIKTLKVLVVTKSDLIPQNIKKDKLVKNICDIYDIEEDIILTSARTKENFRIIEDIIASNSTVLFAGYTNAGKSSLINALFGSNITVSKNVNTTQEFIEIKVSDRKVIDVPGFINDNYVDDVSKKEIKPRTYQLLEKYYLKIDDLDLASEVSNNLTIYIANERRISKRRIREKVAYFITVPSESDLIIKGLGFIKFKKATKVYCNIESKYLEVRPSIIGCEV